MIGALARAVDDLRDPVLRRYLWISVGGALAVFVLLWVCLWLLLSHTAITAIPWLEAAFDLLGGVAVLVLSWLVFPGVVGLISGLLLEDVAAAVEARDYPGLPPARRQGWVEVIRTAAKFAAIVVVANLLILPLYLVPGVNAVAFFALNGYLLGREYYELVALRRLGEGAARDLRHRHRGRWFLGGLVIAVLMTVPIVNLVMPIVATAFMVHRFEPVRPR